MSKQGRASQFNSQSERDAFLKVRARGAGGWRLGCPRNCTGPAAGTGTQLTDPN
jgi:hypothetical protein